MQRNDFETLWPQIRDLLRTKFSELTEEDVRQINGRYDQLIAKLQQRYNISRDEAEDRVRSWNVDRTATRETVAVKDEKYKKDDTADLYKWLLGLGIPLLLLGALLYLPRERTVTEEHEVIHTPVTNQHVVAETPADRAISNSLRDALLARSDLAVALQNVHITTHNGVVTLSGVVANREARDYIEATAKKLAGVKQVVNNLQVR